MLLASQSSFTGFSETAVESRGLQGMQLDGLHYIASESLEKGPNKTVSLILTGISSTWLARIQ